MKHSINIFYEHDYELEGYKGILPMPPCNLSLLVS